mgnify:CR=1 FL=1
MFWNIFKKKKKELPKKEKIRRKALIRLGKLKKDSTGEKLAFIVRSFFQEYFSIHYEFTYDELEKELRRKKVKKSLVEKIVAFGKELEAAMFDNAKIGSENQKALKIKIHDAIEEL